jgi:HD superfamily phosphohydrolase
MPYGHTLESEGNLREREWKDSSRLELWLGSGDKSKKSVAKTIKDFLCKSGISEEKADRFIDDIRKYIPVNKEKQADYLMNLEYPFIVDIVGNTLCADLLDYLDRDMYYCGLREKSGDRVTKYLAVVRVNSSNDDNTHFKQADSVPGKGRIVLLAYRVEREHSPTGGSKIVKKSEIHSEAIDLLRRRYALAEKVYFHRTKIAASAMLISATTSASIDFQDIFDISDEAFISKLANDNNPRTMRLITKYKARQLYKLAYEIKYHPRQDEDQESLRLHNEWYPQYRKPKWRQEKETEIEHIAGFPEGSVVIYCPELGMNLKQFEMLVQNRPDSEIKPLKDILDATRVKEMTAINERFEQLWKLQIFVDPEVLDASTPDEKLLDFSKTCEEIMGFPNQRSDLDYDFKGKGRSIDDQIAFRIMKEYEIENKVQVPMDMFNELVGASRRASGSDRIEKCREHLRAVMQSNR